MSTKVTGFNLDIACFVIFAVCIFYTAIGGIKAVIWTDVFQATCMFGSFLASACRKFNVPQPSLTPEVWQRLVQHDWFGNARELQHYAEQFALGFVDESGATKFESVTGFGRRYKFWKRDKIWKARQGLETPGR